MAQENLILGTSGQEDGELVDAAFNKVQNNFNELYALQFFTDRILSGTAAYSGTGLIFDVVIDRYILNGNVLPLPESNGEILSINTQVTLSPGDPTNPRIDIIVVDENEQILVIEGTPAANPIKPTPNFGTQLEITSVNIAANATTPTDVSSNVVYNEFAGEPTEWTATENTSGARINLASTNDPDIGSVSIENTGTNSSGDFVNLINDSSIDTSNLTSITLRVKNKDLTKEGFRLVCLNQGLFVSNTIRVRNNKYGYSGGNISSYQTIVIPKSDLNLILSSNFDQIRIQFNTNELFIDNIKLTFGLDNPQQSPVSYLGLTDTSDTTFIGADGFIPVVTNNQLTLTDPSSIFNNDNLGNHTATQDLNMDSFDIIADQPVFSIRNISGDVQLDLLSSGIGRLSDGSDGVFVDSSPQGEAYLNFTGNKITATTQFGLPRVQIESVNGLFLETKLSLFPDINNLSNSIVLNPASVVSGQTNLIIPSGTNATLPISFTDGSLTINAATDTGLVDLSQLSLGADTSGLLTSANNLSDLSNISTARTNLGFIDDDSFASATANNFPSSESVKAYVDANSGGGTSDFIYPTDYTGTDTQRIQQALNDASTLQKTVKILKKDALNTPWDIEEALLLNSNTTVIIDEAILKLTDTSRDNIFRTSNCGLGITSPYTVLENIHIKGINGATLEGADNPRATGDMFKQLTTSSDNTGNFSYGTDAGVGGEHQFGNWQNISVLFAFTNNYSIEGLKFEKSHSWSISNERCSFGKFLNLEFNVVSERNIPGVGIRYILNGDGINFRMGCNNMIVDNVKGYTHDDTIACTVLNSTSGEGLVTEGEVTGNDYRGDIDANHNISINNIKTTTLANNIRLLNSTNTKVYNIFIDNVVNTNTANRDNRSVILIGSTTYGDASNLGEMFNVFINNIKNVFMSHCISIDGSLSESSISNVIDESNQNQDDPVYVDPLSKGVRDVLLSNVFKDSITTQLSGILNGVPPFNAPVSKSLVLEEAITVPISQDETTPLVVGTNVKNYRLPYDFSIKEVRAYLNQAASGSPVIVDINKTGLGSLMSSNIRIEDGDKSSKSSPTPPFLTTISLEDDDELTFDIDAVDSGGTASGLKAMLIGYKVKREVLDPNAFIFTTRPTNTFTIPTNPGETYNYNITTSDGQSFKNVTGNQTINFLNTGIHTISITGTFPTMYFNFGAQRSLMGNIVQWGNPNWGSNHNRAFYGCTNLTCTATDNPFSQVVIGEFMFRQAGAFSLTNNMDFTNVTNGREMFRQTNVRNFLNHEFAALQIAPNFCRQIVGGTSVVISAPNLNFASLLGGNFPNGIADGFFDNPIDTVDYSNILIRAAANNPNNNVRFDGFQSSNYNSSAVTARNTLASRGWSLADAGLV